MAWEKIGNIRGPAGAGVPPGGTTGQVLTKTSNADNATAWQTPPGGVTDHGALTGLADDDHPQYLTQARGDARYVQLSLLDGYGYLTPAEVVAGTNVTVTRPGDGTVVIASTGGGGDSATGVWFFDTTTTMADPGSGQVRCNTAAPSAATQVAISRYADDGTDFAQALAALAEGDVLMVQEQTNADKWIRYALTGLPTNNTSWWLLPVVDTALVGPAAQPDKGFDVLVRFIYGGSTPELALDDLTDVDTSGVLDGDHLAYDANSGQWVPKSIIVGAPSTQQLDVTFVADATANLTLTDMAAAEDFLGTSIRHVAKVDLTAYTHVRFVARRLGTAGAAGAVLNLKYATVDPGSTFVGANWTAIPCQVSITAQNVTVDSGWIAMPAGLIGANRYLAVTQAGGDGVADPVLGSVRAFFRGEVSAGGGGGGGASTLDQLTDVTVPTPGDGEALIYVGATSDWRNKPIPAVTVDPATPTGGKDGDLWVQTTDTPWTPPPEQPRGIVAWKTHAQTDFVTVGTTTVVGILQLDNVPLLASRLYKFSYVCRAIGNITGDGNMRVFTPGALPITNTTLMIDNHCAFRGAGVYAENVGVVPFTVTADGNYTLSLNAIGNLASIRLYRTHIFVEDIGPIRGQQ